VREINPRIIAASGSGFGPRGPYAHKGGQDVLAQALSGAMFRRSDPGHPLAIYATALADYAAGMLLVQGILLALRARDLTGEGQRVDVSLYDAMLSMQLQEATVWLMRQAELNWAAKPLSGVFQTADGALVIVGAFKQNPLRDISTALALEDLSLRPEFATEEGQEENRAALQQILADQIRTRPTAYWLERLEAADVLCAPVRHLSEALADEQTRVNDMIWRLPHQTVGEVITVGNPVKLSATPAQPRISPPRLGEHSGAVLAELGYTPEEIAMLCAGGVVA
jgi:formyl-CoA transferase